MAVFLLLGSGGLSEAQTGAMAPASPVMTQSPRALSPTSRTGVRREPPALTAFAATWAGIRSYTATITLFEKLGTRTDYAVFAYTFRKPASVTLHVDSGPNAGANVAWNGGSSVVVSRGRGLFGLFKKKVNLHDPLVTTLRGDSVDQISYGSILEHAESIAGSLSVSVGPPIGGVATRIVTLVPTTPATDGGLTREVLYLSKATNLPVQVLGYDGATLVRNIAFTNVKLTSPK